MATFFLGADRLTLDADPLVLGADGGQTIVQNTRFDNANQFFGGAVLQAQTVTQNTRFDNAQTFYAGSVVQEGGTQTVTQNERFDNQQAFYSGTVQANQAITQNARFDNAQAFYGGDVFEPDNTQTVTQDARFNNAQSFFGGFVTGGAEPFADTFDGFFTKQWLKAAEREREKRKETIEELEEEIEEINEQIEEVESEPVKAVVANQEESAPAKAKIQLIESLIKQRERVLAEIEEEEILLLL